MATLDPQTTLHTSRLVLRPLCAGDAEALFEAFSDPRTMRYWATTPWQHIDRAHEFIRLSNEHIASGAALRLALAERDGPTAGRCLGQCTLFSFSEGNRRAEMGYLLRHDAWGRGLMHEALSALLDHGFGALQLLRVEADIDPRNAASQRSLERLGFQREGLLRERWIVGGEVSDSALYGLLAREWLARRAAP